MKKIVFLISLLILSCYARAFRLSESVRMRKPDYLKLQYAGNIGFLSAGCGYTFKTGNLSMDLLAGYVPSWIHGADIVILTGKYNYTFYRWSSPGGGHLSLKAGEYINISHTHGTFLFLPEQFPKGYYTSNAVSSGTFLAAYFRPSLADKQLKIHPGIYLEAGSVNKYLWYLVSKGNINPASVFSLGIGVEFRF